MELRITLAPDGGLRLLLPQNRALDVGATPATMHYIQRILRDAGAGRRDQRGYIGEFPTQHVIDIWKKQDAAEKALAEAERAEAKRKEFEDMGINLDELEIQL